MDLSQGFPPRLPHYSNFLKTVSSNEFAASCVWKLAMEADDQGVLLEVFGRLAKTGLSYLTGLLDIYILSPKVLELLSNIHFPTLRNCIIPLSDSTGGFLRLHPNIIRLVVFDEMLPSVKVPLSLTTPSVMLPNLVAFMGPHTVAPVLLDSRTPHVSVPYGERSANPRLPVISVPGNSVPSLVTLINIVMHWDSIPPTIMIHLPALVTVKIRRVPSLDAHDNLLEFLWSLDDMIRALPRLKILHTAFYSPTTSSSRAAEFEHVRRWCDISPALSAAVFPSGRTWTCLRTCDNIWCPDAADYDWFIKEVASSTSLPTKYMKAVETIFGERLSKYRALLDLNGDRS